MMTDFTPKHPIHTEVFFCEEHDVSITTACCDKAKTIGWFDTFE